MLRPGRIRDPVHAYIPFTAIERALLDDPVAQRLRHVSQSAAAHLVYPEMRVSRFAHSLGAMHLASRFLAAALSNAEDAERRELLQGFHQLVKEEEHLGLGAAAESSLMRQGLITGRDVEGRDRVVVLLIEQALRLASLVHDLGHLPFSHDFELALEDHFRANSPDAERFPDLVVSGRAVHEAVGYELADVVQRDVFNRALADQPMAKPAEVALLIARRILHASPEPGLLAQPVDRSLSWLHELVAGEVDVDRADYVLRDVRHYGLIAAGYDLDRLIDHLTVILTADGELKTAILPQGVGAAEAFLVARFRMYAWAVYHHKVQQAAAGLRLAIEHLLTEGGEEVRRFLNDINALASGAADDACVHRFVDYDDVWWLALMRRAAGGVPPQIKPWLELFLRRRPGPVSLWKRPAEFPVADRRAWNRRLPGTDDISRRATFEAIRRELRTKGILVERLPFRPWRADADGKSSLKVLGRDGELSALSDLSSLVFALEEAWNSELQVLAFTAEAGTTTAEAVIEALAPALQPEETA